MLAVIAFIVILGLLVFVHEAGHFIAARRADMTVEEFGFGFPPRLIGVQKVHGRWRAVSGGQRISEGEPTIYSVNWIPLGGFVRIKGEDGNNNNDPKSFGAKPRFQRALVLASGVSMNLLLAVFLFSVVGFVGAPQVIDDIPAGAKVRQLETRIVGVLKESPAAQAGLKPGDAIMAIDGQSFERWRDVQQYIRAHINREIVLKIDREGKQLAVPARPVVLPEANQPGIGVQLIQTGIVSFPIHRALWHGVRTTGIVLREILVNLGALARGLVTERRVTIDVAGPVGIAVMTGQVVQLGLVYLLQFAAVLSANLALLNIFPFPALDGGRLFLLLVEAIRRRALAVKMERAINTIGFAVLILLIIAVTYHDIVTFGGGFVSSIRSAAGF